MKLDLKKIIAVIKVLSEILALLEGLGELAKEDRFAKSAEDPNNIVKVATVKTISRRESRNGESKHRTY